MICGSPFSQHGFVESLHLTPVEPVAAVEHPNLGDGQAPAMPTAPRVSDRVSGNELIGVIR